ncbi:Bcr/CflA family efflux MFS transporter [Nocardioides panacisoli]|uniref:Multidrug effflux MFS transporter n=1 Tax=Nocardioides panacisoli TaxID=627624 RepID=A0ABP7IJ98_9ACTN
MTTTAPAPAAIPDDTGDTGDSEEAVPLRLLVTLAFIAAFSPLAVDLYLASFPEIRRDLATSPGLVQLTLTAYLVGVSVGQPVWGPLSDRYGRRSTLLVSNAITVVSSVAVVLAPTIGVLIGARLVQALSAASGMVIARAMVADLAKGYAGVRALALMMTTVGAVPVVAPAAGGALAAFLPWRGVLAVLAVVVAVQLVVTVVVVRETLPPEQRSPRLDYGDLARVVARPAYVTYALTLGLCVGSVMSYVASASFVYQDVLGFTPLVFGIAFAVNALGMTSAGFLSARLARRRHHPARTVARALPGAVLCCLLVVAAALSPWPLLMVVPVFGNAFFSNLVMGNCMGLAMEQARGLTGAGSAMLGLFMFGISALVTPMAGLIGGVGSAVTMGLVMTSMSMLASLSFALGRAWIARHPVSEAAFA